MSTMDADVLVVGGGPAGASAALRLLDRGVRPVVVERERFPRFHIGESMTGECGALVRELGFGDRMTAAGHPVKHGVVVYGHRGKPDWFLPVMQRTADGRLLDQITWQVRRSVFDSMLLDEAVERGAVLVEGRAREPVVEDGVLRGVVVRTADGDVTVRAPLTLDCSGQATFLANRGVTGPKYLGAYDKQIALFGHVPDFDTGSGGPDRQDAPGNTHIFYTSKFRWAWAIPIEDGITSIGIVVPAKELRESGETPTAFVRRQLRELNPGLAERAGSDELVEPAHVVPNYSFQVRRFAGPGFVCVGDSHRFVDPIFSFGLYVALRESKMAVDAAMRWFDEGAPTTGEPFRDHMVEVERGVDILEDTIDVFWENPLAFAVFAHDRYRSPIIDIFAGRVFPGMPNDRLDVVLRVFRRLLGRERTYDDDGLYSVPIGSRFHPERAPLWNSALDDVATTERWMREHA